MNIPHFSELPHKLKTAINIAHYDGTLCPSKDLIFHAFYRCKLEDIKVVIIGQEPYNIVNKSNGLAFGYNRYYRGQPEAALANIIKEVEESTGSFCGDLTLQKWAEQGVLLINTRLTTVAGKINPHLNLGWEQVVTDFLQELAKSNRNTVWLLWGGESQSFAEKITNINGLVIKTTHPSPFSASKPVGDIPAFTGSDCFAETNDFLERRGKEGIKW